MKFKLNKTSHDRKTLYTILGVMVVFVFALSVAYAVLSATLNISGWADIASSSWDIHFANVKVKSGNAAVNPPQLTGSTSLWFNANLANQGDYYEFTVDVVNDGKIDAMVDYIYTSPELTEEQRKYLKYEVTYENGQSIESRQNLRKQSSATIKVRIEYRSDITESDLVVMPTSLGFNITLVYIQSDGSGVDVPTGGGNNEPTPYVVVVSGDGSQVGDEICIGEECFYVISSTEDTVTMLSKYNLYVGFISEEDWSTVLLENPTGKQDESAKGAATDEWPIIGGVSFSASSSSAYSGSDIEGYVNNYNTYLTTQGVTPIESRLITRDELINLGCILNENQQDGTCSQAPQWVYSTSYWTGTPDDIFVNNVWNVWRESSISTFPSQYYTSLGVRPVITISRSLF